MLLVQFWDARKTWCADASACAWAVNANFNIYRQWLPLDKLRLLGEDKGKYNTIYRILCANKRVSSAGCRHAQWQHETPAIQEHESA